MAIYLLLFLKLVYAYPWGMFNPGVYIGARYLNQADEQRYIVDAGFMWGSGHKMKHEIDDSIQYTATYNDPGVFAVQNFRDESLAMNLTHVMINDERDSNAWRMELIGQHMGKTKYDKQHRYVSVVFYVSISSLEDRYEIIRNENKWEAKDEQGKKIFEMEMEMGEKNEYWGSELYYMGIKLPNTTEQAWKVKSITETYLRHSQQHANSDFGILENRLESGANLLLLQTILKTPFSISINFNNPSSIHPLSHYQAQFDSKFHQTFGINSDISKSALSNLLSGIGLFTGSIFIQEGDKSPHYSMYNTLFTCTPSRKVFPRGFLWDEGFHQLIVCRWNEELCIEMMRSWLSSMREDGWIPREQIRGREAESKVPKEFILQRDNIANPPTLLYPIQYLIDTVLNIALEHKHANTTFKFLANIYPKLTKWLEWLRRSQINKEGYAQWQGRSADHTLASGLDDYPRGLLVQPNERHLDLHIWILFFYKTLRNLASLLDLPEEKLIYDSSIQTLRSELTAKFWDGTKLADFSGIQYTLKGTETPAYLWRGDNKCGATNLNPLKLPSDCNPYSDSPCCSEFGWCGSTRDHCNCPKCKRALKLENREDVDSKESYSPHIGYVTLLPLIDNEVSIYSPEYEFILNAITSKDLLRSEFGLRSLSKSDILYKTGEEYWRGPIWMNFNYLTLRALKLYYWEDKRAQEVYESLRAGLMKSVRGEWERTGYFYEQYSDENGKGRRTRGFTGWTGLILLIESEFY